MLDLTAIGILGLLVVVPIGLGIATLVYENKLNEQEQQEHEKQVEHCCHECCGCMGCSIEHEVRDEEECGCCGKPLTECECACSCHKH